EAERFVLSENENAAEIGIDAIGESDVNDAIGGAERDGRLGAVARERPQTLALTAGEKNDKSVTHVRHGASSGREAERRGNSSRGETGSKRELSMRRQRESAAKRGSER